MTGSAVGVRPVAAPDAGRWIDLRHALWPDQPRSELAAEADAYLDGRGVMLETVLVAADRARGIVGIAEMSLRPYAEGCETTPVAFLEAWYVVPEMRGPGVGRALVAAAEDWARRRGCRELASDTTLDNAGGAAARRRTRRSASRRSNGSVASGSRSGRIDEWVNRRLTPANGCRRSTCCAGSRCSA